MKSQAGPLSMSVWNDFQPFFPSFSAVNSKVGRHAAGTAYNIQGSTIQLAAAHVADQSKVNYAKLQYEQ